MAALELETRQAASSGACFKRKEKENRMTNKHDTSKIDCDIDR